jgi:hypothetical protein
MGLNNFASNLVQLLLNQAWRSLFHYLPFISIEER